MRFPTLGPWISGLCFLAGLAQAQSETFDCVVQAESIVDVGSPVQGILDQLFVRRGGAVEKGDLIAELDARLEAAAFATAEIRAADTSAITAQEARTAFAETQLARALTLRDRGTTTQEIVDGLEAEKNIQLAELERLRTTHRLALQETEQARVLLEQRRIIAPLSGIVLSQNLDPGEYVRQDTSLVTIANIDPLRVQVFLPSHYFSGLSLGGKARVSLTEPVLGDHVAEVTVIDRVFDAASNTFGVELSLANPEGKVPAGQRCKVTFARPTR